MKAVLAFAIMAAITGTLAIIVGTRLANAEAGLFSSVNAAIEEAKR